MRLLYGTTTLLVVTLADSLFNSKFRLHLADSFNFEHNPDSANPFKIFEVYQGIVAQDDRGHAKYLEHVGKVEDWIIDLRGRGSPDHQAALNLIRTLGTRGVQPYLAVLECDTYEANHGTKIVTLPPHLAASPTSIEYVVSDISGPALRDPELHLHKLF